MYCYTLEQWHERQFRMLLFPLKLRLHTPLDNSATGSFIVGPGMAAITQTRSSNHVTTTRWQQASKWD